MIRLLLVGLKTQSPLVSRKIPGASLNQGVNLKHAALSAKIVIKTSRHHTVPKNFVERKM